MKSLYGDRDTVGTIYLEAQKNPERIISGDLSHDLMIGLCEDINEAIASNPYENKPFYIIVNEKKHYLMPSVDMRRVITMEKRPYPEDSQDVFWCDPKSNKVKYCWTLPHKSVMQSILANENFYSKEYIANIKNWLNHKLEHFGFYKNCDGKYVVDPKHNDLELTNSKNYRTA